MRIYWLFAFYIFLSGCMVGPNYKRPQVKSPDNWSIQQKGITEYNNININWWRTFNDSELNSLIERAVKANLNLRVALERLQEARALREAAIWSFAPVVDMLAFFNREQRSANGEIFSAPIVRNNLYDAEFDASWEIDIFGGERRALEAATANMQAAQENSRDVLLSIISEVARNYVEYRGFRQRLDVLKQNILSQSETVDLTESLYKAGINSQLDVEQAAAQLATTKSQFTPLDTSARQNEYQLAILLGLHPAALLKELSEDAQIPPVPPVVPIGLPSELLRRRPDIRNAERLLAQATANIGVQTAELFPKLNLLATAGYQSTNTNTWFTPNSAFWSFGPQFSWRILEFGTIGAQIKAANAVQRQALATYEQTILNAFGDVENSLIAYTNEKIRYDALAQAVEANKRTLTLAKELYTNGIGNFLSVLDAQRSLYLTEDQLAASRSLISEDLVALYKALGGGWEAQFANVTEIKAEKY